MQELEIHSYSSDRQQKTLTVELPSELKQDVGAIVLVDDIVDSGLTMKVAGTVMQHFLPWCTYDGFDVVQKKWCKQRTAIQACFAVHSRKRMDRVSMGGGVK